MEPRYDVIMIGSDLASLSAAALLVQSGRKVCILESRARPKGASAFLPQTHSMWGCGQGDKIHSFLTRLGLESEILFEPLERDGYDQVFLPNGRRLKIPYGYNRLAENVEKSFPGQGAGVRRFTAVLDRLAREIAQLPDTIQWWQILTQGWKFTTLLRYHRSTLQQVLDDCAVGAEAQSVLSANSGHFMCPPEQLSILAYNALFSGYNRGAYYPRKHLDSLIDRLVQFLTDHPDCHLSCNTEVVQMHTSGGRVGALVTRDGRRFTAPTIVCGGDPRKLERFLSVSKPIQHDFSLTAVTCRLTIQGIDLRDHGFGRHNTWHLEQWDVNRSWDEALGGDWSRPWMFMSTPALLGDECETQILELATTANYEFFLGLKQLSVSDYLSKKQEVANRLIDLVEAYHVPNLRRHIKQQTASNVDFDWATPGHAYGSHLSPKNLGLGRNRSRTGWKNLFRCDAAAGQPGVTGAIDTGMQLYMELTGDRFWSAARTPNGSSALGQTQKMSLSPV